MKYIFDFDDVLFYTTRRRHEHLFPLLERAGIARGDMEEYYKKALTGYSGYFSMKELLAHFSLEEQMYEEIMRGSENFVNTELIEIVKKIGKKNCHIITYGDKEFQLDKIKRSGITPLFSKIFIVQGGKKEIIEKICAKYKNEKVIFVDDKAHHFKDLDFKKYPNLKTILYTGQSVLSFT